MNNESDYPVARLEAQYGPRAADLMVKLAELLIACRAQPTPQAAIYSVEKNVAATLN